MQHMLLWVYTHNSRLHIWFEISTKGFSTVIAVSGVLNNISKVYQNLTMQKV